MAYIKDRAVRDFRLKSDNKQRSASKDFAQITAGKTKLNGDIAVINGTHLHTGRKFTRKDVDQALNRHDIIKLREISAHFFDISGIYARLCRYMAYLYRYDYFVTPIIMNDKISEDQIIKKWIQAVAFLDKSDLKKQFGDIALSVIKYGCYYGYRLQSDRGAFLQELPVNYCRSKYKIEGRPVVELNMKYFDDAFPNAVYRTKILKIFDKDIQRAYILYKQNKLPKDSPNDDNGWYVIDPALTVKFNLSNSDLPVFAAVIPSIIDLDEAQDLDKEKMKQQLLRVIVQEMPIDKNGDLIFDLDEVQQLHANAVQMLADAIGVNVLTTFADVSSIDMSDKGNVSSVDQLEKTERTVYNEAGVSQMQFNTSTNLALEKSIANDEATMTDLLLQFADYTESLLKPFNKSPKNVLYKVDMLPTTIYNYQDLSKLYKEQTMIGFSKMLPQVALGQSQLTVMSTAYFENNLLHLDELFIPPQMSSTMSKNETTGTDASGGSAGGRPTLSEDDKSEKTIANQESG